MPMNRRQVLVAAPCALAGMPSGASAARVEPADRRVTLVDPFTAGSNTDLFSRLLAELMGPLLGWPMVVANQAGGGGSVGAEVVARAEPDGHTLGMASVSTLVANPASNRALRYDPLADFTLISTLVTLPSATVVAADSPIRSLDHLVALARARPGALSFASPGIGSAGHVLLEHFSFLAGARFMHVPYRGSGPIQTDLLGGRIDVASENIPTLLPHIQSGRLRVLAIRDLKRLPQLPDAPTFEELGYAPVSQPLWFGLVGPAGMAQPLVERLNHVAHRAITSAPFRQKAAAVAATVAPSTPQAFRALVRRWLEQYRATVRTTRLAAR